MICAICEQEMIGADKRVRYCSSQCRREAERIHNRRRHLRHRNPAYLMRKRARQYARRRERLLAARDKRFCRVCGTDISWRFGQARYCGNECSNKWKYTRERELTPERVRTCRKCGDPVQSPRLVCDKCKVGRRHYINDAKTLEDRLRRMVKIRQSAKKHKKLIEAAYSIFRELQGSFGRPLEPELSQRCIVCGIKLTGWRKRMCGSLSCKAARERERRLLIAAGKWKFPGRRRKSTTPTKRQYNYRARYRREYAAYLAMRELNLLPKESEL